MLFHRLQAALSTQHSVSHLGSELRSQPFLFTSGKGQVQWDAFRSSATYLLGDLR